MKILFLTYVFPVTSETFILNQIAELTRLGHEIQIFSYTKFVNQCIHPQIYEFNLLNKVKYSEQIPQSRIIRVLQAIKFYYRSDKKQRKILRATLNIGKFQQWAVSLRLFYHTFGLLQLRFEDFDVAHVHFGISGAIFAMAKEAGVTNLPFITSFHGGRCINNKNPNHIISHGPYKWLKDHCSSFTYNSLFIREKAVKIGFDKKNMISVPMGVCLNRFTLVKVRKIKSQSESIKILTVARLVEKKGIHIALKALALLISKNYNITYTIVGEGKFRPHLEKLIDNLGLGRNIQLVGAKDEIKVKEYYENSDIFVLSSITCSDGDTEGQGVVLLEAQAMEIPVVATYHNGFPQSVSENKSAFLVPENNSEELAKKLEILINNPELRIKMGQFGAQFVRKEFDVKKISQKLAQHLSEIKNRKNKITS